MHHIVTHKFLKFSNSSHIVGSIHDHTEKSREWASLIREVRSASNQALIRIRVETSRIQAVDPVGRYRDVKKTIFASGRDVGVEPKILVGGKTWKTLLKWMIWGYHYFWKHPFMWRRCEEIAFDFMFWKWYVTLLMVQKSGDHQLRLVVFFPLFIGF